jgi:glycolate oxidase
LDQSIADELRRIVGADHVLTSRVDLSVYDCDAETLDVALPEIVVLPGSSEETAEVVRIANKYKMPFLPRGAGTGLSGGATAIEGGIVIVTARMTRVLEIDPYDLVARVEVGATNLSVSLAAQQYDLYFAPDPSSQSASTVGGNLAENAGGPHCLKYGMTTNHILGATVVLPDGRITKLGGRIRDHLSLDLLGVFVGSEGTLGLATEATLRLTPRPQAVETLVAYFPSVQTAGQAVSDIVASGVVPAAMEMIDKLTLNAVEDAHHMGLKREAGALLIVELDGPRAGIMVHRALVEKCLKDNGVTELTWARDAKERAKIWKARKTSFGSLGRIAPHAYVLDGVIPRSKLAEAIQRIEEISVKRNLVVANVYHAGDGNLHPAILYHKDNKDEVDRTLMAGREILQLCVELGGTLSGEHGIGVEKILEMSRVFSEADLEAMGWIKHSFNPANLCNPGKVLPTPKSCGESGARSTRRHMLSASSPC